MKSLREAAKIGTTTEPVMSPTGLRPPKGKIVPKNNFPPKPVAIEEPAEYAIDHNEEVVQEIVEEVPKPTTEKSVPVQKEKPAVSTKIEDKFLNRFVKAMKSMLSDSHDDNAISSKRVIAFLAFMFCSVGFFVDLFTDYQITQTLFDSMIWIVVAGLGFTGLEKFAPKE